MAKKKITEIVKEMLQDFLDENGYELYNTEFVKEGRDWFLRVYIDKTQAADDHAAADADEQADAAEAQYIGTEDCEKVSRFLSEKLDEADPVQGNYYLEVSSPGMDRQLYTREQYLRYIGHEVEVKLFAAVDGRKNVEGTLAEADDE